MSEFLEEDLGLEAPEQEVDLSLGKGTCYGLRFNKEQVIVTVDNKNVRKFTRTDFPSYMDLDNLDQVSSLVASLREMGLEKFVSTFNLPEK